VSRRIVRPVCSGGVDGLGGPSVASVLDDATVGDNDLDWVTPCHSAVGSMFHG
jgi:hypothetical protein